MGFLWIFLQGSDNYFLKEDYMKDLKHKKNFKIFNSKVVKKIVKVDHVHARIFFQNEDHLLNDFFLPLLMQ